MNPDEIWSIYPRVFEDFRSSSFSLLSLITPTSLFMYSLLTLVLSLVMKTSKNETIYKDYRTWIFPRDSSSQGVSHADRHCLPGINIIFSQFQKFDKFWGSGSRFRKTCLLRKPFGYQNWSNNCRVVKYYVSPPQGPWQLHFYHTKKLQILSRSMSRIHSTALSGSSMSPPFSV